MCKRLARPNSELCEEIDMRSMNVGTRNGVRVCGRWNRTFYIEYRTFYSLCACAIRSCVFSVQ